jgi:hypothetical protein
VRDETAALTVEFEYEKGFDAAVTDVSSALERIAPKFPEGMRSPAIFRISDASSPVVTLAAAPSDGSYLSMEGVRQMCDNEVREAFLRLDGVADVEVFGAHVPEIQIVVDQGKAAAYGLAFEHIFSAISPLPTEIFPAEPCQEKTRNCSSGWRGKNPSAMNWQKSWLERIPGGGEIFLGDISEIRTGIEERKTFFHGNGKSAIGLNILRPENGNVMDTLESVEEGLPGIQAKFPGISFEITDTQGDLIRTSVSNLFSALRSAVLLTVAVIFFFLARMRITLLAAVSIPFTFLLTFAGMKILGFELNIVTMTGVILAVGLLVDDAVVVIENIDRRWQSHARGQGHGDKCALGREGGLPAGSGRRDGADFSGKPCRHYHHCCRAGADYIRGRVCRKNTGPPGYGFVHGPAGIIYFFGHHYSPSGPVPAKAGFRCQPDRTDRGKRAEFTDSSAGRCDGQIVPHGNDPVVFCRSPVDGRAPCSQSETDTHGRPGSHAAHGYGNHKGFL